MSDLIKLIVLFFVIFDPLLSAVVFVSATKNMSTKDKIKVGFFATGVAIFISGVFLIFGNAFLSLFSTNMMDLKVAGGILLALLGLKMALGYETENDETKSGKSSKMGVASLIGTPLLTGPAAITTIIISAYDFGKTTTGLAVLIVLAFAGSLFFLLAKFSKNINKTLLQVMSTILGLITLAWGINFIRTGLGF